MKSHLVAAFSVAALIPFSNLVSYLISINQEATSDGFGFPFYVYEYYVALNRGFISYWGILLNLVVCIALGLGVYSLLRRPFSKGQLLRIGLLFWLVPAVSAQKVDRTIAVTIDDLPVVVTQSDARKRLDITRRLLEHIKKAKVPAIGFVNENKLYTEGKRNDEQVALLKIWIDAGLELGNHTFSHRSADAITVEEYTQDIIRGEEITKEMLATKGMKMRYFRHPFLQTGSDMAKKTAIYKFLADQGYTVAPVSFDNADYIFARALDNARDKGDAELMKKVGKAYVPYMEAKLDYWERQSMTTLGRPMSHTLLLHANSINAEYFDDLAAMLVKRGYKFVTLEESLKDEAYRLPDNFTRRAGISWLHRWTLDKGKEFVVPDEPMVPEFVLKAAGFTSE